MKKWYAQVTWKAGSNAIEQLQWNDPKLGFTHEITTGILFVLSEADLGYDLMGNCTLLILDSMNQICWCQ